MPNSTSTNDPSPSASEACGGLAAGASIAPDEPAARRRYAAPRLRSLGNVVELTFGSFGLLADGGVTKRAT
jgi:hypothetical protein